MGWMYEQAQEKLAAHRLEAAFRRQLPKRLWRGRLAQVFRRVAERLEPNPALTARTKAL
jgi:hypothetical protein